MSNHFWGLYHTFSEICAKFDAHWLLDPSWNCIRPHGPHLTVTYQKMTFFISHMLWQNPTDHLFTFSQSVSLWWLLSSLILYAIRNCIAVSVG
jgi:hypothetical protein